MSKPLMSAMTLALLSALPGYSAAGSTPRYSASATLVPNPVASHGRFTLQARLLEPGAPPADDSKQPEPARAGNATKADSGPRFKLLASMRDTSAPEGATCGAENLFQNGFE